MFFHINILLLFVDICLHVAAVLSKSSNIRFVEKTGSEHLLEHTKIYNLLPPLLGPMVLHPLVHILSCPLSLKSVFSFLLGSHLLGPLASFPLT
jgi:hypothetical protein